MSEAPRTTALRPLVQLSGFVRKEILDIVHQPRLLLVLIAGPFLVLVVFALGYDQNRVVLRTLFVGPEDGIYESAIASYGADLEQYVEPVAYTSDLADARRRLRSGAVDLVVVFPPDPADTILDGEQAVIGILHEKLDPLQQTSVEVSARVAVLELNATVLERLVGRAQDAVRPMTDELDTTARITEILLDAIESGDDAGVRAAGTDLRASATAIRTVLASSSGTLDALGAQRSDDEVTASTAALSGADELIEISRRLERDGSEATTADARRARELSAELTRLSGPLVEIDPVVLTRPFRSETENLLRAPVTVESFFAPSAIALLLQHLAVTFAAMGLVRDDAAGLFEVFRVGPVGARHVIAGKYLSYLLIACTVGALLVGLVTAALGVPLRGSVWWLGAGIVGIVAGSIGLGLTLSALARSDTQAVQYAMLTLLAGLFFSGFFIDLELFRTPVQVLATLLPVSHGIAVLQDVMLRGVRPDAADLWGLTLTTLVYGALATVLLWRRLRIR